MCSLKHYGRYSEKYFRVEYPLSSVLVPTELPEKIPAVTLKVSFEAMGDITERYCAVEYL